MPLLAIAMDTVGFFGSLALLRVNLFRDSRWLDVKGQTGLNNGLNSEDIKRLLMKFLDAMRDRDYKT